MCYGNSINRKRKGKLFLKNEERDLQMIFTCSHSFILFWSRKSSVNAEIYYSGFCVFMFACEFHPDISSFFCKFSLTFSIYCVIHTSVLSFPQDAMVIVLYMETMCERMVSNYGYFENRKNDFSMTRVLKLFSLFVYSKISCDF